MLMMLAVRGLCVQSLPADGWLMTFCLKVHPADAHDAGCLGALCPRSAQLMLMMLSVWGLCVQGPPADAHAAGCLGALCPRSAQLMLMMLAVWGHCVQGPPS